MVKNRKRQSLDANKGYSHDFFFSHYMLHCWISIVMFGHMDSRMQVLKNERERGRVFLLLLFWGRGVVDRIQWLQFSPIMLEWQQALIKNFIRTIDAVNFWYLDSAFADFLSKWLISVTTSVLRYADLSILVKTTWYITICCSHLSKSGDSKCKIPVSKTSHPLTSQECSH